MEDTFSMLKSTLLLSAVGYIMYMVIRAILNFKAFAKVFNECPGETDFHWLYGNLHKFPGLNEAGLKYNIDLMEKWPRFMRFWMGPFQASLVLYHPDLVRLLLRTSAPKPRGSVMVSEYDMGLGWLGEGLLIANGPRWARSRRLLTPAFHFDILRTYIVVKNRAADTLLDKMQRHAEEKKSFEVFHNVSLCLFDVLLQCAFNHESHCQTKGENDEYVQTINELLVLWGERILKPWMRIDRLYKLMPHGRRWYKLCDRVHAISEELIDKRRKVLEQDTNKSQENTKDKKRMLSFVDVLLTAKDEDGVGMTPLEIRNEADTFLFEGWCFSTLASSLLYTTLIGLFQGGWFLINASKPTHNPYAPVRSLSFDTTTSAMSWTLYSLARWPEHQALVQKEVDAIFKGRSSDDILWEDMNCLPYTTACIKEAMRNYSTVPFIQREIAQPLNLDGHIIPAGTFVAVHIWCLHHNPSVWDKPHDYIPERFLGDSVLKMDPFQFVPFSAGTRNCIGQNFAMHELKLMVARICHRYNLALDPNHKVLRSPLVTFKAENDIKLLITPREH